MAQATRIAFICKDGKLYQKYYTFEFFGGFALSQKHKTIKSFHNEIISDNINNILEVSRKAENPLGNKLSAFNLMIEYAEHKYPVECIYQSSKCFGNIQYHDCLNMEPGDAKRYVKKQVEELKLNLTSFNLFGVKFQLEPKSFFYDYLYIWALSQNKDLANDIVKYDCFTDVEFNHKKQYASQARSCAIFKNLYINNLVERYLDAPNEFIHLYDFLNERTLL